MSLLRAVGAALLALLLAPPVPAIAQSGVRPGYRPLRAEEDWSPLRNRALRTDWLDELKYIPLGSAEGRYLSIGGEIRPWYEMYRNELWGSAPRDTNGFFLQRFMFHADLHWSRSLRVFTQVKSGIESGRNGGPRGPDEDRLDLHQAFVEWRTEKSSLRVGRQELMLGSQRLITVREGPNVRQAFDAIRWTVPAGRWKVDLIAARPTETRRGVFDDRPENSRLLWSVYAVGPRRLLSRGGQLDLYYIGLDRKAARFAQGTAREQRQSFGARIWNRGEALDYNFEFVIQAGRFGRANLLAWTAASDTGYTFARPLWKPRIGLRADVTSGDRDPRNASLQTFNALFPKGNYFGQLTSLGPQNHVDLHPTLDLVPRKNLSVTLDVGIFWRFRSTDGIYAIAGNPLRGPGRTKSRFIGAQPGVEMRYQWTRQVSVAGAFGVFAPGQYLKDNPPARTTVFAASWITWRF